MASKGGSDRRRHRRYSITGKVPGKILAADAEEIVFIAVDVSRYGLGIIVDRPIANGAIVNYQIDSRKSIPLQVKWVVGPVIEDEDMEEVYRCGLHVTDERIDLEEILRRESNIQFEDLT